ncbi:MAG: hypothetical protein ACRDPK_10325 [Carbonactinosporaceae bacterium]
MGELRPGSGSGGLLVTPASDHGLLVRAAAEATPTQPPGVLGEDVSPGESLVTVTLKLRALMRSAN